MKGRQGYFFVAGISQRVKFRPVKVCGFLSFGQAIDTPEIATVGDADPQIAHHPAVGINEQWRRQHAAVFPPDQATWEPPERWY